MPRMQPKARAILAVLSAVSLAAGFAVGCGGSGGSGFTNGANDDGGPGGPGSPDDGAGSPDVPSLGNLDGGGGTHDGAPGPEIAVVYAHSADTLYKLDPNTKAVTVVGMFSGCTSVIDIAIDQASNAYVTTSSALYKLDLATAACTHVASHSYPNSLSFVPQGTLDPNAEALVGYVGSQYIRIDTQTGAITNVGQLTGGYSSSGDIVSVKGGGTFLTVNGNTCGDCLLQVDPKTGDIIQNYGDVHHSQVFGLAFWGGTAYGFDNAGTVFTVGVSGGAVVTQDIPVPNAPANLSFWGAGSTTSAPAMSSDGGGIPIK
jgi:hypothetical protein